MLRRAVAPVLRRFGIHLPFTGVVCTRACQSIAIDEHGAAQIVTRRTLVFLAPPQPGDLQDTFSLGPDESRSCMIYRSPDAIELWRAQTEPGRLTVVWLPREPVDLYTTYEHESGWSPSAAFTGSAVCSEYDCDVHTGLLTVDLVAPAPFETAVIVSRGQWPRRLSERDIVRAALRALKTSDAGADSADGARIETTVRRPRVGRRYIFVAFRKGGVATAERWLQETSLLGRAQRLLARWVQPRRADA